MSASLSSSRPLAEEMRPAKRAARPVAPAFAAVDGETREMRQLRHQTKNALQRILWELSRTGGEECSLAGVRRLASLEQRVCLTAKIADSLFGFTRAPGPILDRLHALGTSMVELLGAEEQNIAVDVVEHGHCPDRLSGIVMRAAHEMIGNALKHGLSGREQGTISIRLFAERDQLRLVVADDGAGFDPMLQQGTGIGLIQDIAAEHGGSFALRRVGYLTAAELTLPLPAPRKVHAFPKPQVAAVMTQG